MSQRPASPEPSHHPAHFDTVFLGAGNMGGALIEGLFRAGRRESRIGFVETCDARAQMLLKRFPSLSRLTLGNEPQHADRPRVHDRIGPETTLVVAIKPQSLAGLAEPLQALQPGLVVSIMAGVPLARLREIFAAPTRLVRSMPNTPALIGLGMTGIVAEGTLDDPGRQRVEALFSPVGSLIWIRDEDQMHAVTALSGSGPAYVFRFAEALVRAGQDLGLSEADASLLARRTLFGAASMAAEETDLAGMRAQVTSPGGTTAAALTCLDQNDALDTLIRAALKAAARRSRELASPIRAS